MAWNDDDEPIGLLSPPEKLQALFARLPKAEDERPGLAQAQRLAAALSALTGGIRQSVMQARQYETLADHARRRREPPRPAPAAMPPASEVPTPQPPSPTQQPMPPDTNPTPGPSAAIAPPPEITAWVLDHARAALAGGEARPVVLDRLRALGIDPQDL